MDITLSSSFLERFSPSEQLVLIHLLLKADDYGVIEFSDRIVSRETGVSYQTVRTIHQKLLREGIVTNAQSNAVTNARQTFVRFCKSDSYKGFKRTTNAEYNATANAIEEFENIWNLYKKKVNRTKTLVQKWFSLPQEDRDKIFEFVPKYVALTEEVYRKQFSTFLNQRTWESENIYTQGLSIPVENFKAKLVEDPEFFPQFVERFNMMVAGTKIPQLDMKEGLTEKRRVLFNITYCTHFYDMKQVMEFVVSNPRYNGSTGYAVNYDYIFKPENFIKLLEESRN